MQALKANILLQNGQRCEEAPQTYRAPCEKRVKLELLGRSALVCAAGGRMV